MARQFKLTIREVGSDRMLHEATVESASWTTALDRALTQLGQETIPANASRTVSADGVVTLVDIVAKRKYVLVPLAEAKSGKMKKSGTKSSPGRVPAPLPSTKAAAADANEPNQPVQAATQELVAPDTRVEAPPVRNSAIPAVPRAPSIGRLSAPPRRQEGPRKAKQTVAYIPSVPMPQASTSVPAAKPASVPAVSGPPSPAAQLGTAQTLVDASPMIVAAATEELHLEDTSVTHDDHAVRATETWLELANERNEEPGEASPLVYRERTYFLASKRSGEELEAEIRRLFERLRESLAGRPRGQLIKMAVFDHRFTKLPERAPLLTLEWRDWRVGVAIAHHDPKRLFRKKAPSLPPAPLAEPSAKVVPTGSASVAVMAPIGASATPGSPEPNKTPAGQGEGVSSPSPSMSTGAQSPASNIVATGLNETAGDALEKTKPVGVVNHLGAASHQQPANQTAKDEKKSLPAPSKPRRATMAFASMQTPVLSPSQTNPVGPVSPVAPVPAHERVADQAEPKAGVESQTNKANVVVAAPAETPSAATSHQNAGTAVEPSTHSPGAFAPVARDSNPGEAKSPWTSRSMVGSEKLGQAFEAASDLFFLQTPIAGAEFLVKALKNLTRADKFAVLLYDIDGDELRPVMLVPSNDALRGTGLAAKRGLTRSAIQKGAVVARDHANIDSEFAPDSDALLFDPAEKHALMIGPSNFGGRLQAVVQAASTSPFDVDDQQVFAYLTGRFGEFIHQARMQLPRKSRAPTS